MIDLGNLRQAAEGDGADAVPVTKRWLQEVLAELEESRGTFRSPIVELKPKEAKADD